MLLTLALTTALLTSCMTTASAQTEEPLTASGTIRASELRVSSDMGGRLSAVQAETGAVVEAGQTVAELDAAPYLLELGPAEAAVAVARADLEVLLAGANPAELAAAQAALQLAEAERDSAQAAWKNAQAAAKNPQELDAQIVEAHTQVALAEQGVELAEAQLAAQELSYGLVVDKKGEVERRAAELELQAAREALAVAEANLGTAQALLDQLTRIRRNPVGLIAQANAAEGQYRVAEEGVAVARAKLADMTAGPTAEEIAITEVTVRQAEAKLATVQVKLARCRLASPIDGIVTSQALRAGELAAPAATILTVADLSTLRLEVYVPEGRIGHVYRGQPVMVEVDSYPDQSFPGQVMRIGDEPEFTPRNVATAEERLNTFYTVAIRLDNPERVLKPGMPADATFELR
jgi:HlyD family secretion protein